MQLEMDEETLTKYRNTETRNTETLDEVENFDSFPFANDNKLFRGIHSNSHVLQSDIDRTCTWSTNPLLSFHPDTCNAISE